MGDSLKLYVWNDPYDVDYGNSLLMVVAKSLPHARRLAKKSKFYVHGFEQKWIGVNVDKIKPSRVVRVPCGECHEWKE